MVGGRSIAISNAVSCVRLRPVFFQRESKIFTRRPLFWSYYSVGMLKLVTYNIQSGIGTSRAHRYFTEGWKQVLPHAKQQSLLQSIAGVVADHDLVGLQEADIGSLRSGYINQVEYVASYAGFAHVHSRTNRKVANFATSAVSTMSQLPLHNIREVRLPGRIPGRGALVVDVVGETSTLTVAVAHLALGRRDRLSQVDYLGEILGDSEHAVLMGDMNCPASSPEIELLNRRCGLIPAGADESRTFPSWRPLRGIDHVLVCPQIPVERCEVLNHTYSDHRPISVTLDWQPQRVTHLDQAA